MPQIQITNFSPENKGQKLGMADILIPEWGGMYVRGLSVWKSENRKWISFPARKTDDIDERGFDIYQAYVGFNDKQFMLGLHKDFFDALDVYLNASPHVGF